MTIEFPSQVVIAIKISKVICGLGHPAGNINGAFYTCPEISEGLTGKAHVHGDE